MENVISPKEAAGQLDNPEWVFVDCRFVLGNPEQGRQEYQKRHIAGAVYADLEKDLSGKVLPGVTGRHPLPLESDLNHALSRLGIGSHTQVVAYDEATGAMAAARLWWLLKWAGHDKVAVLDGGFRLWIGEGLPCRSGVEQRPATNFEGNYRLSMTATADELLSKENRLIDSRAYDRYRGENETIDPVGGHIPGALSMPYEKNLTPDGRFAGPEELRARFERIASGGKAPVFYCGSGVTAAHNILAFVHAGFQFPKLYAGSWSEWIADPRRPVKTGEDPHR